MNCRQAQPNLFEYSQNILSSEESRAVREHLEACAECRAVLEDELRLAKSFAALPKAELRADVWPVVQSQIKPKAQPVGVFSRIFENYARRAAIAVATAAVVAGTIFGVGSWHATTAAAAEKERVREAIAIIRVQPTTEEPAGSTTDAMLKVLNEQVPTNNTQD